MMNPPATPAEPAYGPTGSVEQPQADQPPAGRAERGRLRGFRALRHPGFRIYFAGMIFRGLAMWMPLVAIPWLAVELGATAAQVGIVTGFFFLPTFFVGPLGGVLADRVERRKVLIVSQLFASALSAVIFLLILSGSQTCPCSLPRPSASAC